MLHNLFICVLFSSFAEIPRSSTNEIGNQRDLREDKGRVQLHPEPIPQLEDGVRKTCSREDRDAAALRDGE